MSQHTGKHQEVAFKADGDCAVIFDNGIELKLKKDQPKTLAFSKEGTYRFTVVDGGSKLQCMPTSPIIVP